MFKQLTTILILLAFIAQTFNRAAVVANYYTNTAAYAKNCINKTKPQLHCNGKCQMMKQLKEEEKKEQQNNNRKSSQDEVLSSKSFFASITITRAITIIEFCNHHIGLPIDCSTDFFHPPGAIASI